MMKNINKKRSFGLFSAVLLVAFSLLFISIPLQAAVPIKCPDGYETTLPPGKTEAEVCANHQTGGYQGDSSESNVDDPGSTTLEPLQVNNPEANNACGDENVAQVKTSFDFGCTGKGNAIVDLAFAFFRFLTAGVGVMAIASIVLSGIQYSAAQGDPQMTQKALKRISSTVSALFLYMLIYALIEWLVPGGLFNG